MISSHQRITQMRLVALRGKNGSERMQKILDGIDRSEWPPFMAGLFDSMIESQASLTDVFATQIQEFDELLASQTLK